MLNAMSRIPQMIVTEKNSFFEIFINAPLGVIVAYSLSYVNEGVQTQ